MDLAQCMSLGNNALGYDVTRLSNLDMICIQAQGRMTLGSPCWYDN